MVLETLSSAYDAEMHPYKLVLHGMLYTFVGLMLSLWTFPEYASIITVFLVSLASMPLLYAIIRYEEEQDIKIQNQKTLLKQHAKAIRAYFMLFIGVTLAFAITFLILPADTMQVAFQSQIDTYETINPHHSITGQASTQVHQFNKIFLNNFRVMTLVILFSFLYGAGAIFILSWNASVLGLAIGFTIREVIADIIKTQGAVDITTWLAVSTHTVLIRYGIHGAIEMIGYMVAGLAGGIISVAAIRHHFQTEHFQNIVVDSADLILIALLLLLAGAAFEAWITPLFML